MELEKYSNSTSLIDVLFLLLLAFLAMLFLAILLINPKVPPSPEVKAEFMIVLTWPDGNNQDVDLWLHTPDDQKVFYLHKEGGLANLERDDIGMENDYVQTPEGRVANPTNREVITLRGILPGHYIANVQYYKYRAAFGPEPVPVKVELIKINPYSIVTSRKFIMKFQGQETTAFQFDITNKGMVTGLDFTQRSIIEMSGIP